MRSDDARNHILRLRVGMLIIAACQAVFWVVRAQVDPGLDLHPVIRSIILAQALGFVVVSFLPLGLRYAQPLSLVAGSSAIAWQAALSAVSGSSMDFILPLVILVFAVCGISANRREMVASALAATMAAVMVGLAHQRMGAEAPSLAILLIVSATAAGSLVSWFRLRSDELLRREIRTRKRIAAELRATQAHLESILNATSDGLLGVRYADGGHRISFANRRFGELFALDPDSVVGKLDAAVRAEASGSFRDPELFERDVQELYRDRAAERLTELDLVSPREGILERWSGPITDPHGSIVGRIWAFRDVTAARRMAREREEYATRLETTNAELGRASRAKDAFLANLSHELRTPLSVIIGYQNLVLEGGLSAEEAQEFLQRSTASATHLLQLISDMLDLTRLEAGTAELTIEPLPVAPLVREVRDLAEVLAAKKGLALRVDTSGDATVLGDRQRVKQVLINLVGNALKFTSEGEIRISAEQRNGMVYFRVSDTGRGISPEQQGLLFQKFMRLDTATTSSEEGVGLGLSICRELVTLMGGEIALASPGLGLGTEVRFALPGAC
jgi:signal transduction histidine kinase